MIASKQRRFFIAVGADGQGLGLEFHVPEIAEDLRRMTEIFTGRFGYEHVRLLDGRAAADLNPTKKQFLDGVRRFVTSPSRTPDDILALYFIGHGKIDGNSETHHLLLADTDIEDVAYTGLKTEELASILRDQPSALHNVLIILDTCFAGRGGTEILRKALNTWDLQTGLAFLASALPTIEALPGTFSVRFDRAVQSLEVAGFAPESVSIAALVAQMCKDPGDDIVWSSGGTRAEPRYLPNPRFDVALRDADLLTQLKEEARRNTERAYTERFLPAAKASLSADNLWDFTGRHKALAKISAWIRESRQGLVVTGGPGSGKTAVLGLVASLADVRYRPAVPLDRLGLGEAEIPPPDSVDEIVYAGRTSTAEIVRAIAVAAGIPGAATMAELRSALQQAAASLIIVDAVDEAQDPEALIEVVLRPLLQDRTVRLILGMRPNLLSRLEVDPDDLVHLDGPYADPEAVRRHTEHGLIQAHEASPFRGAPADLVAQAVDGVVSVAGDSFLVARLLARLLAGRPTLPNFAGDWAGELPRLPGDIMEKDLRERLGAEGAHKALDLLRPLAFAEGDGLPCEDVWAPLASRISGRNHGDQDVLWLRENAGSYAVEADDDGHSVYRPYHKALAEHLQNVPDPAAVHRHFADFLIEHTPVRADGTRDWARASFYTLKYLSTHVEEAQAFDRLGELMLDAGYLLHADANRLLGALQGWHPDDGTARQDDIRRAIAAYHQAGPDFIRMSDHDRPAILDLAVQSQGAGVLRAQTGPIPADSPWRVKWVDWKPAPSSYLLVSFDEEIPCLHVFDHRKETIIAVSLKAGAVGLLGMFSGGLRGFVRVGNAKITGLATAEVDGRYLLATSSATAAGMWDRWSGRGEDPLAVWNTDDPMWGVAFADLDDRTVLHALLEGHIIKRFDVRTLEELPDLRSDADLEFLERAAFEIERIGDRDLALIGTWNKIVAIDLRTGRCTEYHCAESGYVSAIQVFEWNTTPYLVAAQRSHRICVIDMTSGTPVKNIACPESVLDLCITVHNGIPYAVAGYDSNDHYNIELIKLVDGDRRYHDFPPPNPGVNHVRVAELMFGRKVIIATTRDGRIKVWNFPVLWTDRDARP